MRRTRILATGSAFVVLALAVGVSACTSADDTDKARTGVTADDIPVAKTPPGGWTGTMPAPVLADLASFFGGAVNPETQQRLVETVRHGLAGGRSAPKRVEVVGWLPGEGVMALAVYPEG